MENAINTDPKFQIGQIVALKSYYGEIKDGQILITGDPLHLPPLMLITGIEVEDKKKVTHDKDLGKQIAEFVKYHVTWFDNKRSAFVHKVLYQSMLDGEKFAPFQKGLAQNFVYGYGKPCLFKTAELEIAKKKNSTNFISDKYTKYQGKAKQNNTGLNERNQDKQEALMSFVCPPLICTGISKNATLSSYDNVGKIKRVWSEQLVKVMWFNYQQQKYSEAELPLECLVEIKTEVKNE
jgi:hypothetical protein